jgi:hypothetical protein
VQLSAPTLVGHLVHLDHPVTFGFTPSEVPAKVAMVFSANAPDTTMNYFERALALALPAFRASSRVPTRQPGLIVRICGLEVVRG